MIFVEFWGAKRWCPRWSEIDELKWCHLSSTFFPGAEQLFKMFGSEGKLPDAIFCGWHESTPARWLMILILIQLQWCLLHPEFSEMDFQTKNRSNHALSSGNNVSFVNVQFHMHFGCFEGKTLRRSLRSLAAMIQLAGCHGPLRKGKPCPHGGSQQPGCVAWRNPGNPAPITIS